MNTVVTHRNTDFASSFIRINPMSILLPNEGADSTCPLRGRLASIPPSPLPGMRDTATLTTWYRWASVFVWSETEGHSMPQGAKARHDSAQEGLTPAFSRSIDEWERDNISPPVSRRHNLRTGAGDPHSTSYLGDSSPDLDRSIKGTLYGPTETSSCPSPVTRVTAPNAQPVFSFLLRFLCLPYTGLSNLVDYEDCVFVALHMSQNTTGDLTKTRIASRMSESCRGPRCRFVIDQRGVIFSIPLRQESTRREQWVSSVNTLM